MTASLWDGAPPQPTPRRGGFLGQGRSISLAELEASSLLAESLEELRGRSVLISMREQWCSAVAMLELDGVAARMVLCPSDLSPEQLADVAVRAAVDSALVDAPDRTLPPVAVHEMTPPRPLRVPRRVTQGTEWILLTSGTTGAQKLVLHSLESLSGALPRGQVAGRPIVWSTFYDIRRYGGLQIYLRAVLSDSPLVLSSAEESTRDFLARARASGVTHISGTPSHWRRALMTGDAPLLQPEYVRLSGEVADQPLLDNLRAVFPRARIAHAFASTEAGLAFEVNDGLEGFPAALLDSGGISGGAALKVENGTLWIKSGRTAARYLAHDAGPLRGDDGYVDTGDMIERLGERCFFRGRKGGVINVGGLKVFPEEVEAVLNADPRVRMSRVKARRSPITGAVVVAEVVLANAANTLADAANTAAGIPLEAVKNELLSACRRALPAHKVPTTLRIVPSLDVNAAGKLVRPSA